METLHRQYNTGMGRGVRRREFLRGAAALGAVATLGPVWLTGCSDDTPDNSVGIPHQERAQHTMHFDLSEFPPDGIYVLRVIRSATPQVPLQRHTVATRQRFAQPNTLLARLAHERLTHYCEVVDLPADAPQHLMVFELSPAGNTPPIPIRSHLHVPSRALRRHAEQLRASGAAASIHTRHAKMQHFGLGAEMTDAPDWLADLNNISTPLDAARTVVYHDPSILNLDEDLAAIGATIIDQSPLLNDLATTISAQGKPTATSGWVRLIPATDENNQPVLNEDGTQVIEYVLSDTTLNKAGEVIPGIAQQIFSRPDYQDQNWHVDDGVSAVAGDTVSAGPLQDAGDLSVALDHPPGATLHGVHFDSMQTSGRTVTIQVRNRFLRYVNAYAQFLDANADVLPLDNPGDQDSDVSKLIAELPTNNAIFGVPLMGDLVTPISLQVDIPTSASYARLLFGSMGLGGEAFSFEAFDATVKTGVFNLAIPTFLLAAGVGVQSSSWYTSLLSDPEVKLAVYAAGSFLYAGFLAGEVGYTRNVRPALTQLSNKLISILLKSDAVARKLSEIVVGEEAEQAIPFVGWALKALSIAADVATIGETVGEVCTNPAIFTNTVALTMDTTVTIFPDDSGLEDPTKAKFPDVATFYILTAHYVGKVSRTISRNLGTTKSDPIVETFEGIPAGGTVTVEVNFYSDTGWVAGHGVVGPVTNVPQTASALAIKITENLVPLTSSTTYSHKEKLVYNGTAHVWQTAPAPAQTRQALDCLAGTTLCDATALTFGQQVQMVGYAWRAGVQNVPVCGGTVQPGAQLSTYQNISVLERPQDALKFAACGYTAPALIAYERNGHADGSGRNFVLEPTVDGGHLRRLVLDETQSSVVLSTQSWGFVAQRLDAIAVHPAGCVIGIDSTRHNFVVFDLPDSATTDDQAPSAVVKAGFGTRPGLLNVPRALAIAANGDVLVLEQGNSRIQALDRFANPVPRFAGQTTSVVALPPTDAGTPISYLAIEVEPLGYLYVLSYLGTGTAPADYRLDIYDPDGAFVSRTTGVPAARLAVDIWRSVYTLNYETLLGPGGRVEPSVSLWIPSTPPGE